MIIPTLPVFYIFIIFFVYFFTVYPCPDIKHFMQSLGNDTRFREQFSDTEQKK